MSVTDSEKYRLAQESRDLLREAIQACMDGSVPKLETSLNKFLTAHPNYSPDDFIIGFQSEGRTLLHIAASSGKESIFDYISSTCKRLKDHVNLNDNQGFTPLIYATIAEADSIIKTLLDLGADPYLRNKDGAAAVHFAAGDGNVHRMRVLLDLPIASNGALCVNAASLSAAGKRILGTQSSKAGTPLHWAAGKARSDAILFLIRCGVDVNATNNEGLPAVLLAAVASCDEGVRHLVEAGADVGALLAGNLTLLHICAEHGLEQAVESILRCAGETARRCCALATDAKDGGNTPLQLAAMASHESVARLLLPHSPQTVTSALPPLESESGSESTGPEGSELLLMRVMADGARRMEQWTAQHGCDGRGGKGAGGGGENTSSASACAARPHEEGATSAAASAEEVAQAEQSKQRGNALFLQQKLAEAAEAYSEAIQLDGNNAAYWSNRSACYLTLATASGASRSQPVTLAPVEEEAWALAQKALEDAEMCRRLRPEWTKGCYRLAAARLALGQFEDAALAAFEGVKLDQGNAELKALLQLCVKRGQEEHRKGLASSTIGTS